MKLWRISNSPKFSSSTVHGNNFQFTCRHFLARPPPKQRSDERNSARSRWTEQGEQLLKATRFIAIISTLMFRWFMGDQLNCQNSELDWFWVARIELLCQRKIADGAKRDLKFIMLCVMLGDEGNHGHKTKTFFRHILFLTDNHQNWGIFYDLLSNPQMAILQWRLGVLMVQMWQCLQTMISYCSAK